MFRKLIGVTGLTLITVATMAGQVVNVAPVGSPTVSGRRLLRAVQNISGPSATNPWLVKIEPGIYDLGDEVLVMRPFVDIEGSGQGVTTITAAGVNTVFTASDAEIRELTIENTFPSPPGPGCTSPTNECHAVVVQTGSDAKLTDVTIHPTSGSFPLLVQVGATVEMNGGSINCPVFCHGVQFAGTTTLQGVSITALDTLSRGIDGGATINIIDSTIDVGNNGTTVALQVGGASGVANVQHSIVRGRHNLLFGGQANIGASQVVLFGTATDAKCVASYDASFNPLGANCQP